MNQPPAVPSNPSPANGAQGVAQNVQLQWNCNDPDGNPLVYEVFIGNTAQTLVSVAQGLAVRAYQPQGLANGQTYFWRVVADDQQGMSSRLTSQSPVWSFTVEDLPQDLPSAPSDPSPEEDAVGVSQAPDLGWSCPDGDSFDVYLDTSSNPTTLVANGISSHSFKASGLLPATRYSWKVAAGNDAGKTTGPVWFFATSPAVEIPDVSVARNSALQVAFVGHGLESVAGLQILVTYDDSKIIPDPSVEDLNDLVVLGGLLNGWTAIVQQVAEGLDISLLNLGDPVDIDGQTLFSVKMKAQNQAGTTTVGMGNDSVILNDQAEQINWYRADTSSVGIQ